MLLRTAQRPLVRLLVVVLLASLLPPSSLPVVAAVASTPQFGPTAAPASALRPQPLSSAAVPQLNVTPANLPAQAAPVDSRADSAARQQHLPLAFVGNAGQSDARVRFQTRGMGGTIFFTPREVVFALPIPITTTQELPRQGAAPITSTRAISLSVVRMQFDGANANPTLSAGTRLPGAINLLRGNKASDWRTQLASYANLRYQRLYPGIDLDYTGDDGQLKST